jgi:hypothetical protein
MRLERLTVAVTNSRSASEGSDNSLLIQCRMQNEIDIAQARRLCHKHFDGDCTYEERLELRLFLQDASLKDLFTSYLVAEAALRVWLQECKQSLASQPLTLEAPLTNLYT